MIAVAVVALLASTVRHLELGSRYNRQAARHAAWEAAARGREARARWPGGPTAATPADVEAERALAEYHSEMRQKYERAARATWLPVADDPPPPR